MFLGLRRRLRYRVKPPALYRDQPFRAHRLFSVVGEAGLLPIGYKDQGTRPTRGHSAHSSRARKRKVRVCVNATSSSWTL